MESLYFDIACTSVDLIIFGITYAFYRKSANIIQGIQGAPELPLDNNLKQVVMQAKDGVIRYGIIRGTVQSIGQPIPSQHIAGVSGVIQELQITEHKVRWNHFARLWSEVRHVIQESRNEVPFCLSSGNFVKVGVQVVEPSLAKELSMSTVFNVFTPNNVSLGGAIVSWFHGEHSKGFCRTEKLLLEGSLLTGIGEIFLENNELKIRAAKAGYFLTPLTKDNLINKFQGEAKVFGLFSAVFACLGIYFLVRTTRTWWTIRLEKANRKRHEQQLVERRRLARDSGPNVTCVVCLTNPVEVLILNCGHVCLCLDCSEKLCCCPICRSSIVNRVPAFLP